MKKFLAIVLSCAMILAMGCTAFAAGSTTSVATVTSATDKSGAAVSLTTADVASNVRLTAQTAANTTSDTTDSASDWTVVWQQDLTAPAGTTFPMTITFNVASADSDDIVIVWHYENNAWVEVGRATGSTVTGTFNSLSPVALTVKAVGTNAASAATSPATGVNYSMYVGIALIMAAGVSMVAVSSKKKA